ncbi:MAG: DOMON-like domain-containing protein [Novosphingobium sp.]
METHTLICHPETPPRAIKFVNCQLELRHEDIWISFIVEGPTCDLSLPKPAKPQRTDGLWKTTCFELFVKETDGSYSELNFSPSHQWAAYGFSTYRSAASELQLDWPPNISTVDEGYYYYLSVLLPRLAWDGKAIALSTVIEETDGTKSYWALAHPPGAPDFHHPSCFTATLPAPKDP